MLFRKCLYRAFQLGQKSKLKKERERVQFVFGKVCPLYLISKSIFLCVCICNVFLVFVFVSWQQESVEV